MLSRRAASTTAAAGFILLAALIWGYAPAHAAKPPNDNFGNAELVGPGLPIAAAGTTVDSTVEPGEPNHFGANAPVHTVWYSWTPSASLKVDVDVCDGLSDLSQAVLVAVYTGSGLESLTQLASSGGACITRFNAVAGTSYHIAIDDRGSLGQFTFRIRAHSPPPNDDFANAQTVGPALPVNVAATNLDSGWETGEPGQLGGADNSRSVWFEWTPASDANARIDTCDFAPRTGSKNIAIGVYTGSTLGALSTVASTTTCRLTFDATAATEYKIAFSGNVRGEGPFTLEILETTPPANDKVADATPVAPELPVSFADSNLFATVGTGEPAHGWLEDDVGRGPFDSVWYSWTPSADMDARVDVCDAEIATRVGVYTGPGNPLIRVSSQVPITSQPYCTFRWQAIAGTQYRIGVGGSESEAEGSFTFDLHEFNLPNTKIKKAKVNSTKRKARFKFGGSGAEGFECKLSGQSPKLRRFKACSSPKTYKRLKRRKHAFYVRAVGPDGRDPTPAKRKFRIR